MRMRKLVALAGTVLAVAATSPASADHFDFEANVGVAGIVSASVEVHVHPSDQTPHLVAGECTFAGALTPANTLIVGYGGHAAATGPAGRAAPLLTAVGCRIMNASGNEQYKDLSLNGSASVVADSTALATSGPKEWPVEDITVCVSGFAVWGPTPVTVVELTETCATPNG